MGTAAGGPSTTAVDAAVSIWQQLLVTAYPLISNLLCGAVKKSLLRAPPLFSSSYRASVGPDRSSLRHSAPVQIQQARRVTFSDFHSAQHQCHTSHSGSQLPYQCNLVPCNIMQKHLIQCNYIQCHACRSVPMFTIFWLANKALKFFTILLPVT